MAKTTLRIPDDLYAEVERQAEREDRSVNWTLVHLIRTGLGPIASAAANDADHAWTCHECGAQITEVGGRRDDTAVPCGHYVTHVQMLSMSAEPPSWPITAAWVRTR
jgi:hypothetical protein